MERADPDHHQDRNRAFITRDGRQMGSPHPQANEPWWVEYFPTPHDHMNQASQRKRKAGILARFAARYYRASARRNGHRSQTESRNSDEEIEACKILILRGFGAGDGVRTRDVQLGKLAFYH
jgi:hypothetical protein